MLRLPSFLCVMAAVSPQAISTLDHHFGDHHLGSSQSSSSGCSHSSTSSSTSSSSSGSSDPGGSLPTKHVFVTHSVFEPNMGGSNGADAKCQAAASAAGLSGSYIALVSSGKTSALSRVTSMGPYYSVTEELSYATKSDFLATSFSSVTDELGGVLPPTATVWSGSDASGNASTHDCLSWTSNASTDDATLGTDDSQNLTAANGWGAGETRGVCNAAHALFCVEQ